MRTTTRDLTKITRLADELGATLPTDFADNAARLVDIHQRANTTPTRPNLDDAFATAFAAGKDPLTDKNVRAAITPPVATNPIRDAADRHAHHLATTHADAIIESFRPPFDAAAHDLTDLHAARGPYPLLGHTGAHVDQALAANQVITKISQLWHRLLFTGTRRSYHELHVILDADPERWWRTGIYSGHDVTPWDAVCVGFTLNLATSDAYSERGQATEAERDRWHTTIETERRSATAGMPVG